MCCWSKDNVPPYTPAVHTRKLPDRDTYRFDLSFAAAALPKDVHSSDSSESPDPDDNCVSRSGVPGIGGVFADDMSVLG